MSAPNRLHAPLIPESMEVVIETDYDRLFTPPETTEEAARDWAMTSHRILYLPITYACPKEER